MKPENLLLWMALALAGISFLPETSSVSWHLLDQSLSMAQEIEEFSGSDSSRIFYFAETVNQDPKRVGDRNQSQLGAALREMKSRMAMGDSLFIRTDGRSSDPLPTTEDFAGMNVVALKGEEHPRFLFVEAPRVWPASGFLEFRVRLHTQDIQSGELSCTSTSGQILRLESMQLEGSQDLRCRLYVSGPGGVGLRWQDRNGIAHSSFVLEQTSSLKLHYSGGALPQGPWHVVPDHETADGLWLQNPSPQDWKSLAQGESWNVVISKDPVFWASAPEGLEFFTPARPARPITVLLDRSGSIGQNSLDSSLDLLNKIATGEGQWRLWPFGATLESPVELPTKRRLAAHGATRLALVLEAMLAHNFVGGDLLLVADGLSEPPPQGWAQMGLSLRNQFERVFCIASGDDPNRATLNALGSLVTGNSLANRLRQAVQDVLPQRRGMAWTTDSIWFDFPKSFDLVSEVPRMTTVPGAFPIVRDSQGAVLAAARIRHGKTWLAWCADPADLDPSWLVPFDASLQGGNWHRRDRVVSIDGEAVVPQVGLASDSLRPLSPGPRGRWRSGPWPEEVWLVAQSGTGTRQALPPPSGEFLAPSGPWKRWLGTLPKMPPSRLRAGSMCLGLLFFTGALLLAWRRRR